MQELRTDTFIKFDFIDSLKILFGRAVKVSLKIDIPQEEEIESFNTHCDVTFEKASNHFVRGNRPPFGYVDKFEGGQ